jgi:methionyl-tRNA synthetase
MAKKIYLTTAIPYVNASPHIGHALEFVQADAIARYHRMLGYDVYFSSGSDENSLKNVQAAEKENMSVQKLVDKYAIQFENLKDSLNISWDVFNRTSFKIHYKGAQKLWEMCKKEDIYKKNYRGLYCVGCEAFYALAEIIEGKCPDGHTNIEEIEEENYFFKLSNYQDYLLKLIESNKLKILPEKRRNEVVSFIKHGLEDFSISRSRSRAREWGVPVPGDESQVMYVWFDALTTYLTAIGFGGEDKLFKEYWLGNTKRLHVIGKGITRFHAVYWPAMLASAGLPLPTDEFVHGYVTVDDEKISKSLGNVVSPFEMVDKFGQETIRYYLLREIPAWGDGDFSVERLKEIYNGELANGLGNLVARVARLAADVKLIIGEKQNYFLFKEVSANLDVYRFDHAMEAIWQEISRLDKLINEEKPWELEGNELKEKIHPIAKDIKNIAYNLLPFLPETANKILKQFTGDVTVEAPLFPRI